MSANVSTIEVKRNVKIKSIALPSEHGSWGFLFEPLVAALAVAFSPSALWVAILIIGLFLARQPLKVFLMDWQAGRNLPQTAVAFKFILFFGVIFLVGLIGTLAFVEWAKLLPFAFVLPFALYQIYCDASKNSRQLIPELTGAITISSTAAVIALIGGWTLAAALALWAIFICRLIPSILYVRNRLRLEKGKDYSAIVPIVSHLVAIICVGYLVISGVSPFLPLIAFVILLGRAIIGLSDYRQRVKAMKIGIWEVIYGVLVVLTVIIGYNFRV